MSDTVNITIQVLDQVSATISTVGTQGPSGSQIMVDQTNDTRTGIWVLDDNDIYLDKTVAQDTTRTGPYVDFDLMEAQGYLVASDMQAAATWADVYARTSDPLIAGMPWNDGLHFVFSAGPAAYLLLLFEDF